VRADVAHFEYRAIVAIRGELDVDTAGDFGREIEAVLGTDLRALVLDLNYCTFVDSVGAAALRQFSDRAHERGITLELTSVPRIIEPTLRASGLLRGTATARQRSA
jgi:anti-anti-sigma factor